MRLPLFEIYAFSVQRPWHSPNTLPTMVYGQAFRIITWLPPSLRLSPVNLYKYTNGQSRDTCNIGHIRHWTKTSKAQNTTQETKKMINTDSITNRQSIQVLAKGQQSLLIIRQPPCCPYDSQILSVKLITWTFQSQQANYH